MVRHEAYQPDVDLRIVIILLLRKSTLALDWPSEPRPLHEAGPLEVVGALVVAEITLVVALAGDGEIHVSPRSLSITLNFS